MLHTYKYTFMCSMLNTTMSTIAGDNMNLNGRLMSKRYVEENNDNLK